LGRERASPFARAQIFRAMRETGSYFADAVLLVVAADEGCLPQTVESIKIAKVAGSGGGGGGVGVTACIVAQEQEARVIVVVTKADLYSAPKLALRVQMISRQLSKLGLPLQQK
jgi:translation elongation factor EF-Tu-like GTPase